ncbi:MAG TPA: futalosine hydrolase [Geobacteraceae bacterium]|mgnify:FL=1|nr:futalosine hydrolase [Geobacteraceae bacterium]
MTTIAITAATRLELSALIEIFRANSSPAMIPWDVFTAQGGSANLIFAVSGIGTANASAVTSLVAHLFSPDLIIATGCAGAYQGSGLEIGDLALATAEIFADEGVMITESWRPLDYLGIPLLERHGTRFFNELPLSERENAKALRLAKDLDITLASGRFLTVATCSGTKARGTELEERFNGLCENMEGAAVALVAARYGIECLEVRGISNRVEDRDISRWDIGRAAAAAQRFLECFLRSR